MKKPKRKCTTPYCRNKTTEKYCHRCKKRIDRERYPERAAYQHLKDNAKRRGKEFDLTFEQFKQFAIETEYITKKGKKKHSLSIDRRDNDKGYTIDNIQVLTLSQNSRKKIYFDYDWESKTGRYQEIKPSDNSDCPF